MLPPELVHDISLFLPHWRRISVWEGRKLLELLVAFLPSSRLFWRNGFCSPVEKKRKKGGGGKGMEE